MPELTHILETARKAAHAAALVILRNYGMSGAWRVKGDAKGLVTQTDLEAEEAILQILSSGSDYAILSEESGLTGKEEGPFWVVDPLDGTNNFSRTLPLFAVSIGLMQGNESLLGVIVDPVRDNEYYAIKGHGAFCNRKKLSPAPFSTEYIPNLFLNHGYAQKDRNEFRELTGRLANEYNILKLGTTALELCYVANGSVDGFICSGDELWDFAAGMSITQEAGCLFTDWKGNSWDGKGSHLLVCRPEIHDRLIDKIKDLQ